MTEEMKKFLAISGAVVSLSIAGWVSYDTFFGDGWQPASDVVLLCTTCGGFEIPIKEYSDFMAKNPQNMQDTMMPMGSNLVVIPCPKCGKKTCCAATKCPKCKNIFVFGQAKDQQFPDRCPKCKFSEIEDMQKNPTP